jgi:integrase/recombinase XerD
VKHAFALRSKLSTTIARYLELNLSLGKQYENEILTLKSLDRFLSRLPGPSQELTAETFWAWCESQSELTPRVRLYRMRMIRKFCSYCRRTTPDCFVPDPTLFPRPGQTVTPYIFSELEVAQMLRAASSLERKRCAPLRPEVIHLAIVLLYTTGLRMGEMLRLVVSDFDPRQGTLLVRNSKFHKSRVLPLHGSVCRDLRRYLRVRRQHKLFTPSTTPLIGCYYQSHEERAYSQWGLLCNLRVVMAACNIRKPSSLQPRAHDFRHSFAVNSLIRWYRSGADVSSKLPFLSAYLGHVGITCAYHYLHFVEPLRTLSSGRFNEAYGALVVPLAQRQGGKA